MRTFPLGCLLLLASFNASAGCYDDLKKKLPDGGVIVFGEYHGTLEAPRFFLECVREFAAQKEEVSVFLEFRVTENPLIARYLGGTIDERALVQGAQWKVEDGRSSMAMLDLLRELRTDVAARRVTTVSGLDHAEGGDYAVRDRVMAENFLAAYPAKGYSLVLVGNVHARLTEGVPWDPKLKPFAMVVRQKVAKIVSLDMRYQAGTAWSCAPKCEADSINAQLGGVTLPATRAVAFHQSGAYDGTWYVGKLNASPPARPRYLK